MQIFKVLKSKHNTPHKTHTKGNLISKNVSHPGNREFAQPFRLRKEKPTNNYLEKFRKQSTTCVTRNESIT